MKSNYPPHIDAMREQFCRIAHAVLKKRYPFFPQRNYYVAKMWVHFIDEVLPKRHYKATMAKLLKEFDKN